MTANAIIVAAPLWLSPVVVLIAGKWVCYWCRALGPCYGASLMPVVPYTAHSVEGLTEGEWAEYAALGPNEVAGCSS